MNDKEKRSFIDKAFTIQINHYNKLKLVNEVVQGVNPMLIPVVEQLSDEIDEIQSLILDVLNVSIETENLVLKQHAENGMKDLLKSIMAEGIKEPLKYKDVTIDMLINWRKLYHYTDYQPATMIKMYLNDLKNPK